MRCPNCHHQRQEYDPDGLPGVCPACGIAYAKWLERQAALTEEMDAAGGEPEAPAEAEPRLTRLLHYALFVPSDRHESAFWGHALIYAIFTVWGWRFILNGLDADLILGSVLHYPDLAFHEYGHVAFSPFGEFMMLLGGSLFQVLLPLGLMAAFMIWQRENFGASLMLWWCGQNFIDVSPYIADASTRSMPLVGGGAEVHDWGNLLGMTGMLDSAGLLAGLCFAAGAALILLSNLWGAALLYVEVEGRGALGMGPK